jgi:hypothetical protein
MHRLHIWILVFFNLSLLAVFGYLGLAAFISEHFEKASWILGGFTIISLAAILLVYNVYAWIIGRMALVNPQSMLRVLIYAIGLAFPPLLLFGFAKFMSTGF